MSRLGFSGLLFSLSLGWCLCVPALGAPRKILHTPRNHTAEEVLKSLLSSPLGKRAPSLDYRVILVEDRNPNAFSTFQGKITITSGIFPVLDDDRGVWAAVIGHELGHVVLHHPDCLPGFEAELRQADLAARSKEEVGASSQWPQVHLGQGIYKFKLSREEELQADFIGMMLMAEAGYQPGFAVLLDQRLRNSLGDMPGMVALFSHHPRLETREEHTRKFYNEALAIFLLRWPGAARSPGGNLPPYGALGRWTLQSQNRQWVFHVPFEVHNAAGMRVRVAVLFLHGNLRVRSRVPAYRASDGSLVVNSFVPGATSNSAKVTLRVPKDALATQDRKLLAVVFLMADNRVLDVSKLQLDLH